MRTTATALAALVTVPALLLTAACGGGSGSGEGEESERPGAERSTRSAGEIGSPLSGAQLEKAAIARGDLPGYRVTKNDGTTASSLVPRAAEEDCAAIALASGKKPTPDTENVVVRVLGTAAGTRAGRTLSVSLVSTSEGGSAALLRDVKAAVPKCAAGFGVSAEGRQARYARIRPLDAQSPADETVGYSLVLQERSRKVPMNVVVTREGSTVAVFTGMNLKGGRAAVVPQRLLDEQVEKLAGF